MVNKKKILFIQHTSVLGGSPLSLLYIIQSLDRKKFIPSVMFLGGSGEVIPLFKKENIKIINLKDITVFTHAKGAYTPWFSKKMLKNILNLFKINYSLKILRSFFNENQYDVIHLNTSCLLIPAIAAKKLDSKVIFHIREELHNGVFGVRKFIFRKIFDEYSDTIISISRTNAKQLNLGEKVKVIYNSINLNDFNSNKISKKSLKNFNIPENRNVFCMLGGAVHSKGANILLEAAKIILKEYPNTYFLIAGYPLNLKYRFQPNRYFFNFKQIIKKIVTGEPNMHFECTRILKNNNILANRVKFIGFSNNIPALIASSNALIWPATQSHFSRPIIEAYAMRKPVIASDFQSSREIVNNYETGILFKPNDSNKLAESVKYIIDNPESAKKMGENAYLMARNLFNSRINSKKIIKHFIK